MSNTYTSNVQFAMPAVGDTGWAVAVNGNCVIADALTTVGGLAVVTTEVPSATLNIHVAAGTYLKQDGTTGTFAGSTSTAVAASSTRVAYLDLTASGALTLAASYPTTAHIKLATIVTGATTITSITDNRQCFPAAGSILDGTNWTFGTTTGTQIGTATSQKIGFYGKTPAVQPTMGAATAGTSYGTNEQGMLQAVYNAVRALGLGS